MNLTILSLAVSLIAAVQGIASAATATASMTSTIMVTSPAANTGVTFGGSGTVGGTGSTPINVVYPLTAGDMTQPANTTLTFANTAASGPVTAVISFGPGTSAAVGTRRASFGGYFVNYQLRSATGQVLDLTGGTAFGGVDLTVTSGAGGVANVPYTVFVPGGQNVPPGTYTDVIQIFATF